jgi:hypothetical protein
MTSLATAPAKRASPPSQRRSSRVADDPTQDLLTPLLRGLPADLVQVLDDRRIPNTTTRIDHLAISTSGVYVIHAQCYRGTPQHLVEGGFMSSTTSTLLVGSRDCTKLVRNVQKQVCVVQSALGVDQSWADVPVHGVLCFIDGNQPLLGGAFAIDGLAVLGPQLTVDRLRTPGRVSAYSVTALQRFLAWQFPAV